MGKEPLDDENLSHYDSDGHPIHQSSKENNVHLLRRTKSGRSNAESAHFYDRDYVLEVEPNIESTGMEIQDQMSYLGEDVSKVLSSSSIKGLPVGIELVQLDNTYEYLAVFAQEGELHHGNPLSLGTAHRYAISTILSILQANTMLASSMTSGFESYISEDFGGFEVLALSLYVLGYVAGAFIWPPLSEVKGRRITFIISLLLYIIFSATTYPIKTFSQLLGLRFATGFAGSSANTNSGSTIGDIFNAKDRGTPMAFYSIGSFAGPALGPVIGSFVAKTIGWRWNFVIMAAFGGVLLLAIIIFVPETYPPVVMDKYIKEIRESTGYANIYSRRELDKRERKSQPVYRRADKMLIKYFYLPLKLLLTEPICAACSIYLAFVYGVMYLLFPAYPIIFREIHHIEKGVSSLPFLGILVGACLAVPVSLYFQKRFIKKLRKMGGRPVPEMRLTTTIVGGPLIAISLIWLGWSGYKRNVHPIVPALSSIPFGLGTVLILRSIQTYLIDVYEIYSASAQGANAALRSTLGGVFPLFATGMFHRLHVQWGATLLFFIMVLLCPIPILFRKYGGKLRQMSEYASSDKR